MHLFQVLAKKHCLSNSVHGWSIFHYGLGDIHLNFIHKAPEHTPQSPAMYLLFFSLMESCILLLGLLALPTWTTVATMPTLMRTSHQRAPTSMVSIPMLRLGSSPPPLKTSSALYLRCSQEMHLQEEEVAPPGRKRFVHVDIKVVA